MAKTDKLTSSFKDLALQLGADRVGIASVDRFMAAPPGYNKPQDLMSIAKSVIVIGMRKPVYIMENMPLNPHYGLFGYSIINHLMKEIAYRIAVLSEKEGYRALPVTPTGEMNKVEILSETKNPKIKMTGIFSHRHAAVAAGLGEIGRNSLFLEPSVGPRIRLISVITEAPLKADPMLKERICQPERCGEVCLKKCPPRALRGDGTTDQYVCRHYRSKDLDINHFKELAKKKLRDKHYFKAGPALLGEVGEKGRGSLTCAACIKACPVGFLPQWEDYPAKVKNVKGKAVSIAGLQ